GSRAMIHCHIFSTPNDLGYIPFSNKELKDIDTATVSNLNVDTISEATSDGGVAIDGLLIKDGDVVHSKRYYHVLAFYDSSIGSDVIQPMSVEPTGYPKFHFAWDSGTIFGIDMVWEMGRELNAWTVDNIANNMIQFAILVNDSIAW